MMRSVFFREVFARYKLGGCDDEVTRFLYEIRELFERFICSEEILKAFLIRVGKYLLGAFGDFKTSDNTALRCLKEIWIFLKLKRLERFCLS